MNLKVNINVCRICMKSDTDISIYSEPNLLEKFQDATQLKVDNNDGLPSIICERCVARLKISYEFRRQSIHSERHLRAFIKKINSDFKEVASTPAINDTMALNDDEMQLLQEAGYKPEEFTIITETAPVVENANKQQHQQQQDSPQHQHHQQQPPPSQQDIKTENIQFNISGLDTFIQDEDGSSYRVEEMQYHETEVEYKNTMEELEEEEGDVEEDEEEDYQDMEATQMETIETDGEGTNIEYIVTKSEDPLAKGNARSHICTKCDKDFSTKTNLMRHILTHSGVKPYVCTICGNGFTQSGSLKQHMLIHTGERPYKCQVCARGFTQSKSLVFHMRRHTGEKPFTCEKCGLTFRQKDGLKRHIQMKHVGGSTEAHICSICQRIFHSKYSLAMHMKKHNGNQCIYQCDVCEKRFSSKASLENHARWHTDAISSNILESTIELH